MALILSDRVKETTITSGTGSVVLTGALGGFQTFNSAIGDGNTTYYVIENDAQFEVGIGTYTASSNSLSRDTVLASSNSDSKIDLSAVSFVFCSLPADKILSKNAAGDLAFTGDVSFDNLHSTTISGQDITSTGEVIANNITSSGSVLSSGLLTMKRTEAGNFFHAYVDDANDRTIGLYSDATSAPEWRLGLKSDPNSATAAPDYAYIFAEDGNIGLVANSLNSMSLTHGGGFSVTNKSDIMFTTASATGTSVNSYAAAYPVITVKATAAQSANLQEWQNVAGTIFANVASDGSINTSGTLSADNGFLLNDLVPNSTTNKIYNDGGTLKFNGSAVGGGGGDGSAADVLANSASGVNHAADIIRNSSSGTATNTSVTNLTTELRTESASGVAISGYASWSVAATGATNAASASTNSTAITALTTELRTESASGVAISGYASWSVAATGATNAASASTNATAIIASGNANHASIAGNTTNITTNATAIIASGNANHASIATNTTNITANATAINARSYQNVIGADVSMTDSDDVVFVNPDGSVLNVYIPTAVDNGGKEILVKRVGGDYDVIIYASGSQTIDGQSTFTIHHNYQSTTLISNNANWFIY